ncbi:hypothetical protein Tco_0977572 [Tanacetum coccineum]|uniref:Uncharacterized protein n=1 Tax=Tanacetum coccineum TaxID=301880 RepID=A0ABQ5EKG5_9ASTR
MKGTCKSLTELEYFCEEVYKATTEKLDWINPEGHQYPHDLRQPLPLVPNSQGRHVIPFHHFINNDLEYLRGGESSRKYSTSVTKGPWCRLRGISHWAKCEGQFYAFATSRESARDVYSKRRIITVTKVEIVEWQNYKHLDWITVRRDDDVLYKFKEGDLPRLNGTKTLKILLLLSSVVIQRRVEDLQLGVESYQKKLNLTKPDTPIDKRPKTRRIMRSLERFVGGRPYGDIQSEVNSFTLKMGKSCLSQHQNKLHGRSDPHGSEGYYYKLANDKAIFLPPALVLTVFCSLFKMDVVWICQILQEISQKRTRERMSDQEAKEIKAEAREIMPQPSTVYCS